MARPDDAGVDPAALRRWVGRAETAQDRIDAWQVAAMHAALDREGPPPGPGTPLPEGWHWLFFRQAEPARGLDADGHAARGGFLPPVPGRRMWAGGRLTFAAPLRVGAEVSRRSVVKDVAAKEGRSGPLVFVTVAHEIGSDGASAMLEEQDLVYREGASAGAGREPEPVAAPCWSRTLTPDPVLLFRYSALTFNSHRIHFDREYCRDVEGYPGLVVHGQLTATLMLDLLRENAPDRVVKGFSFRGVSALYDHEPFCVEGRIDASTATLWALNAAGHLAMSASATLG
jgi:3-methylfumaryl-CoA hydratase